MLDADGPGTGASSITLRAEVDPTPGRRTLVLASGDRSLRLSFPIPAPEISGRSGTLAIAAPETLVLHWPLAPEEWREAREARASLVVLGNARVLFREGEPFERAVADIRRELGSAPLLWAPRVALPHRLPLLLYLGIDILDTTDALWRAAEGAYLDPTWGPLGSPPRDAAEICGCPGCKGGATSRAELRLHAEGSTRREMARARAALGAARLRELVEARLTSEPLLAEHLRYIDRIFSTSLEERTPVTGSAPVAYVLREAQRRPEVRRFVSRFLERYRPPPSKRILLLLPCSRTKPYRLSRSHRQFARAWEGLPGAGAIHVVSVTSPLGLVPRELEDLYPARHYDIPVTGDWDEFERGTLGRALEHLTRVGSYRAVVSHLDPEEFAFLREGSSAGASAEWTRHSGESSTSRASLSALREALERAGRSLGSERSPAPLERVREELESLARMQWGEAAASGLFAPPVRLAGRPWFQRVTDGHGNDLATWREERGLFHLTISGAERLRPTHTAEVQVDAGVPLTGDLFTPGVIQADRSIRTGDAVVLVREGELAAVGEARLPGTLMTELPRGLAVSVRHRARHVVGPSTSR